MPTRFPPPPSPARAKRSAAGPGQGPHGAALLRTNRHLYTDASPLDGIDFAAKVALLEQIDAAARARDPRVAQVTASLSASWSVVEIVRADAER
jgi:TldD protein